MSGDFTATGYLRISRGALARNYATVCQAAPGTPVGAVVKADAYGLGAASVAKHLLTQGCCDFFVATLEEGIALRSVFATERAQARIYVFEGLRIGSESAYAANELRPVLNTVMQVQAWLSVAAPCAVHVDTGMSRLGMSPEEFTQTFEGSSLAEKLQLQYVMMHFACADEADNPCNERQLEVFERARRCVGAIRTSIANSAAAFGAPKFHGDLVRAGIALYGGNPFAGRGNPMEPVVTLYGRVLQIRRLTKAAKVGYGATYEAAAGTRLATVGVGYADGYPRILGNRAHAIFRHTRLPVIGRVSMDLTCLDVSVLGENEIGVGDYVEMFGADMSIDEIAELSGTISYEVLTGLNARLPRIYVE